jgi:hypothetical protein
MSSQLEMYDALVELIGRELELAGNGQFDELGDVRAARAALMAELPDTPPATARAALAQAAVIDKRLTIELLRGREMLLLELRKVELALRAARGYAPPRFTASRVSASA